MIAWGGEQVSKPLAQSPYGEGLYITSTLTLNVSLHFNKGEETCPNINKLSGCPGKSDLGNSCFCLILGTVRQKYGAVKAHRDR